MKRGRSLQKIRFNENAEITRLRTGNQILENIDSEYSAKGKVVVQQANFEVRKQEQASNEYASFGEEEAKIRHDDSDFENLKNIEAS